jgi:carbon storage regulator
VCPILVLSRKRDERIIIGDNISIMVIEIRGDKVRLGIDAPKDIPVHREEVAKAIKREKSQGDAKGLAGANAEQEMYLNAHKSYQAPEDDQPLLDKMEDER